MKVKARKSCREKLEVKMEPRVVDDPRGRGRMLIPRPTRESQPSE